MEYANGRHASTCKVWRVQALDGWPKVCVQVWTVDEQGNTDISGYGFANLPAAPGMYEIECPTWVPEGTACAAPFVPASLHAS